LARWPEIDAQQVGLLGLGLGGDLALRSAAMDSGVAAVLAIEPVLSPRRPGIGLEALRALSWFEARRRSHRWRRSVLVKGLNALAAIPCIAPRPVAIVVGGSGGESHVADHVEVVRLDRGCFLKPATRTRALEYATGWMKEHLT